MIVTEKHTGIETGKSLMVENLISIRKKMLQSQVQSELMKAVELLKKNGVEPKGPMISTTYSIEEQDGQQVLDIEFLFPVNRNMECLPDDYQFKPLFRLVNAVYKYHEGFPEKLQETYGELLAYIQRHKLQQITSGYQVHTEKEGEPVFEVYIGVNPSVL